MTKYEEFREDRTQSKSSVNVTLLFGVKILEEMLFRNIPNVKWDGVSWKKIME